LLALANYRALNEKALSAAVATPELAADLLKGKLVLLRSSRKDATIGASAQ